MEIPIIRFQAMPAHNGGRNRRDFFYLAGTIAVGTTCGQNRVKAVEPESPQIGILLATTFTTGTLEARLDAARACGLACVQMSMVCANLPEMPDQIPAELPERIRREASARGIAIASVTRTFNKSHPDVERRRTGVAAATGPGRGMPADGHILNSCVHWHAGPEQHVAASSGQRLAGVVAGYGRLYARGDRHRPAGERCPGLRARNEQCGRFSPESPPPSG